MRLFAISFALSGLVFCLMAWGAMSVYDSAVAPKLSSWLGDGTAATVLAVLIKLQIVVAFVVLSFFLFGTVNGIVCLPLLDMLSEATEFLETGRRSAWPFLPGLLSGLATALSSLAWKAVCYVFALPFLLIPVAGAVFFFGIGAWFTSLDFLDIPMSRRGWHTSEKKRFLSGRKSDRLVFGSAMMGITMIPLLNIIVPALGTVAGTLLFIDFGGMEVEVSNHCVLKTDPETQA